jgi:hypothetical protein
VLVTLLARVENQNANDGYGSDFAS